MLFLCYISFMKYDYSFLINSAECFLLNNARLSSCYGVSIVSVAEGITGCCGALTEMLNKLQAIMVGQSRYKRTRQFAVPSKLNNGLNPSLLDNWSVFPADSATHLAAHQGFKVLALTQRRRRRLTGFTLIHPFIAEPRCGSLTIFV